MTLGWTTLALAMAVTTRLSYSLTRTVVEDHLVGPRHRP
jgi:hypothetical protein